MKPEFARRWPSEVVFFYSLNSNRKSTRIPYARTIKMSKFCHKLRAFAERVSFLLERYKRKSFLHRILNGREKWSYFVNPRRKNSWVN